MGQLINSIIFLTFVGVSVQQGDPALNFLTPLLKPGELFDGPASVVTAPRTTLNTQLSLADLMYYNYFAGAVYCTAELQNLNCATCQHFRDDVSFATVLSNETTSSAALIVTQPVKQLIVVAFRGSSSIPDLILDQVFVNVNIGSNIKIHRGFYIATMSLYKRVVAVVQAQLGLNPGFKVVITGHSLGASMASLTQFFFKYHNQFPGVDFVSVTYAQPRVGNIGYANYMNGLAIPMVRVVNNADVIPHVTPVSSFGSAAVFDYYVHHQTEYWTNNNTGFWGYCSSTVHEDPTCSNSLGPAYSIVDHGPYFDVNNAVCVFANGYSLLTIPWVLNPDYLPGLLPVIPGFISPAISLITILLYPIVSLLPI